MLSVSHRVLTKALFTPETTTYMAGCTDETVQGPNCPHKNNSDQEFLGLVRCDGSENDKGEVPWSACPGATTKTELGAPSVCTCSDPQDAIITGPKTYSATVSLPTATGMSIHLENGYIPGSDGPYTFTTTASNGQATTITWGTAAATGGSGGSGSGSGTLSTGAKAGIGVGVAALGVGLLALGAWFFIWYRRKHSKGRGGNGAAYQSTKAPAPDGDGQSPPPQYANSSHRYSNNNQPVSPMGDVSAAGYNSGYTGFKPELSAEGAVKAAVKSELPGDAEVRPAHQSELPAGALDIATSQALGRNGAPSVVSVAASTAPTGHASMVSDVSSEGHGRGPNGSNMEPIAELHG